jgi:hypothetical protein
MPVNQRGEGGLGFFPGKLPQQFQIACHFQKYIAADGRNPTKLSLNCRSGRDSGLSSKMSRLTSAATNQLARRFTFDVLSRNLEAE